MADQPWAAGGMARGCPGMGQMEKEWNKRESEIPRVTERREKDAAREKRGVGQAEPHRWNDPRG